MVHNPRMADSILTQIEREVGAWHGVTVSAHRFGGVEFRVGRRELGHLRVADDGAHVRLPAQPRNRKGQPRARAVARIEGYAMRLDPPSAGS